MKKEPSEPIAWTLSTWIEKLTKLEATAGDVPLVFTIPKAGPYDNREETQTDLTCAHIQTVSIAVDNVTTEPCCVDITLRR